MRLFIAIPLPEDIKNYLHDIQTELKPCDSQVKWVNTKNLHMTLKFLGYVKEEGRIESIQDIIKKVAKDFSTVDVILTNFGFFPTERNPRVFFVSTDKEDVLQKIAFTLEDKLELLGFEKEYRFRSHITLARFKIKKNINQLLKKLGGIRISGSFPVNEIILYKSTLTPEGPIYEEIFKAPLKE